MSITMAGWSWIMDRGLGVTDQMMRYRLAQVSLATNLAIVASSLHRIQRFE